MTVVMLMMTNEIGEAARRAGQATSWLVGRACAGWWWCSVAIVVAGSFVGWLGGGGRLLRQANEVVIPSNWGVRQKLGVGPGVTAGVMQ